MSVPSTPEEWLTWLTWKHTAVLPYLVENDQYYDGCQPLCYMHPQLVKEIGDRVTQVVINWPQLVVDSVEERLDRVGFRLPTAEEDDEDLERVWQANDLDSESQLCHVDALALGRGYTIVGTNEDDADTPLVTVESPLQVFADLDPRTRLPRAAIKRWCEQDLTFTRSMEDYATLYLPDETIYYEYGTGGWVETDRDEHGLGRLPVIPIVNRARTLDRWGRSELQPVKSLADAANKMATDMMVSGEYHAMPRRWALGFGEEDFLDKDGKPLDAWSALAGRIWATRKNTKDDGVSVGQFPEADLSNFHQTLDKLAELVASIAGLPPHYLGRVTDNPASADAIRSNEVRLVKRTERKHRTFGGGWQNTMRTVRRFQTGDWDPALAALETVWRDASTPTIAQTADATVKKFQAGIITRRQARLDLGYTQPQITRMEEEDSSAADRLLSGPFADLTAGPKPPANQPVNGLEPAPA